MNRKIAWCAMVPFLFFAPTVSADDAGGCPVGEVWAVPAEALTVDAAAALDVPLIPDPEMLECDVVVECGVRFQEVFAPPSGAELVALDGLHFRIDESTPLDEVDGANCWTVAVGLGVFPYELDQVSEVFDANTLEPPVVVYEGPICLDAAIESELPGLGAELAVTFDEPYVYDSFNGNLLVDVVVTNVAGVTEQVLLDASDGPEVMTVVSLAGADSPSGDVFEGGPVLILDGYPGPDQPGDPVDCLMSLDIPDGVKDRLVGRLELTEDAALGGMPWIGGYHISRYHRMVDRFERRGDISTEAAAKAHDYGDRATGAYFSPYFMADFFDEVTGITPWLTLEGLDEIVGPQLPEGSRGFELMDRMDELRENIFFDGVIDQADRDDVYQYRSTYRRFFGSVWREVTLTTRYLLWDAWRLINDFWRRYRNDPEFRFLVDLWGIISDGIVTVDEVDELKELRVQLIKLLEGLDKRNPLFEVFKDLPSIIHQLAAKLEKGQIEYISVSFNDGGGIGIFVKTDEPIWIKVGEYTLPEEAGGYTISLLVNIADAGFVWLPTENGHQIIFGQDGTFKLNFNADSWWLILYMELFVFGIDLDDIDIDRITITGEDGQNVVFEGTSDEGETIKVEVKNGSMTVTVDGEQVFPEE